ncbi:sulfatase-like hydrolase/transferase [Williamsoniiplasma lucivorax]|uniref:Sulfatase n=1 Tax=Williamsoniiplasma lucivorax TaxID=209274 RepID=A0A2S5RE11_9MOLU|nr:sulfatase-like hydrolase/transferase [Williamsoniiplasma lucivorax]PPE05544.1 sulfatase [Williamsoniiplasma lucivorax]
MKAVMIMFDTLTRKFLPNYGNDWVQAPTFKKLSEKMVTFDNFYGGSMPCMPARRELHTGKYNFLHRSWGQLEVFDHSIFEILQNHKIYTHIVTDHSHYWEDGGATYHTRYNTWEGFRGQENDRWMSLKNQIEYNNLNKLNKPKEKIQYNLANRSQLLAEDDYSSVQTIDAGVRFINQYKDEDNWFLQIECFDPHEPFVVPQKYRDLYDLKATDNIPNYPKYQFIDAEANKEEIALMRKEYAALISMIDVHLKKVIDLFDKHNLWVDTMLMINTDHGFSLGEHNFIGKNSAPFYNEVIHIPFLLYVPQFKQLKGTRITEVAQTIDIPLTILEHFQIKNEDDRDGKSIINLLAKQMKNHEAILFGINGGHVGIFDGKYIYMRASAHPNNLPFTQYTLNFNLMRGFLPTQLLQAMELVKGSRFSNNVPVLKINFPMNPFDSYRTGHLLFDLETDQDQLHNLKDAEIEKMMMQKLIAKLKAVDCPIEEFQRLGLD